jgi:flagellar basal-body rod protein FlgG
VDVISNNLANVNTSGFKRTLMQIEAAPKTEIFRDQTDPGFGGGSRLAGVAAHASVGDLGFGSRIYDTPVVFDQGAIQQTGNPLDVALSGPGFLAVQNAAGTVSYTRGGSFAKNAQNQLVTPDGNAVLGTDGKPIAVPAQGDFQIDRTGSVTANGAQAGQLAVFEFANLNAVRPQGSAMFVNYGAPPKAATNTTVLQGAQEKSNADVITSMVGLIANERWFDANEKVITTEDTAVGAAISTVGKSTP